MELTAVRLYTCQVTVMQLSSSRQQDLQQPCERICQVGKPASASQMAVSVFLICAGTLLHLTSFHTCICSRVYLL